MSDDVFTEPDDTADEWVDVRMTDPEKDEWDVDVVVVGGQVEYVDLRVRPELLAAFVECLVEDVGEERAERVVQDVVERAGVDTADPDGESDGSDQGAE